MISSKFVLETIREVCSFKKILDGVFSDLAYSQPEYVGKEIKAISSFSGSAKGVLGGIHYDMTKSQYGRLESQIISAEALVIASKVDDFIDEKGLPKSQRTDILNKLLGTVTTGVISSYQTPEVRALSIIANDLHTRVSKSPYPEKFFSECTSLANAVTSQMNGDCSIGLTENIGGRTMAVSAIIPYCYEPTLPPRFIVAARKFGGYLQFLDNIIDFESDHKNKINTVMTTAHNPDQMRVTLKQHASKLYDECLSQLNTSEQQMYQALKFLFQIKSFGERYANK